MSKITLKDIADLVNTSPKTVSKALNNKPGVSATLRQKIKDTARDLNYIPNIFGKGLSGAPLKTIGIIVPDNVNPSYSFILKGVEKRAAELRYSIIFCNSNEDLAIEQELVQVLLGKHVAGVIICPVYYDGVNPNLVTLQRFGMPYIVLNRMQPDQKYPCIKTNNFLGGYLAGQYLIRKGHSRVIYITRKYSVSAVEDRIQGFTKAFHEQHLKVPEENIYRCCQVNVESAYEETRKILATRRDFSAIFAFNDIIAYGVMKAVHDCQLAIPDDIAIIGFDNLIFSDTCLVPLTTVHQNLAMIGTIAMDVLIKQIQGEPFVEPPSLPEPYIVERDSV